MQPWDPYRQRLTIEGGAQKSAAGRQAMILPAPIDVYLPNEYESDPEEYALSGVPCGAGEPHPQPATRRRDRRLESVIAAAD